MSTVEQLDLLDMLAGHAAVGDRVRVLETSLSSSSFVVGHIGTVEQGGPEPLVTFTPDIPAPEGTSTARYGGRCSSTRATKWEPADDTDSTDVEPVSELGRDADVIATVLTPAEVRAILDVDRKRDRIKAADRVRVQLQDAAPRVRAEDERAYVTGGAGIRVGRWPGQDLGWLITWTTAMRTIRLAGEGLYDLCAARSSETSMATANRLVALMFGDDDGQGERVQHDGANGWLCPCCGATEPGEQELADRHGVTRDHEFPEHCTQQTSREPA